MATTHDDTKNAVRAMAQVARISKPGQERQKAAPDKLNTLLGYQLIAVMLILFVVVPGIGSGIQAASNWLALSEDRDRYEAAFEARLQARDDFKEVTGKAYSTDEPKPAHDLDTAEKIEAAIQVEQNRTERIRRQIETAKFQAEREKALGQQRIEMYVELSRSLDSVNGFAKGYTERQIESIKAEMTDDELAEAKRRLAESEK